MGSVNTDVEKWITECSCGLEELSITESLLFLCEPLQLYRFLYFIFKKALNPNGNYWDTEAFLNLHFSYD